MSCEPNTASPFDKLETQSSLYEKLPLDLRRQVNEAIVNHQPATYQAVFDQFKLDGYGVSFTAFYRYARWIRTNASLMETAALTLPEGARVEQYLPELVGERFLEAALDPGTSPRTLHRLADTHRIAIQNYHACRRFAVQLEDDELKARAKETDGFLKAANQIAQCQANENFLQTHIANSIRSVLNPGEPPIGAGSASDDDTAGASTAGARIPGARVPGARIPSRTHSRGNPFPCPGVELSSPPPIRARRASEDGPPPIRARTEPSHVATPQTPTRPERPPQSSESPAVRGAPTRVGQSSALSPEAAPTHRQSPTMSPARSQVCSVDPSVHPLARSEYFLPPASTATRATATGLDPPTRQNRSPTLLSERRKGQRRQRRRERHRRRAHC